MSSEGFHKHKEYTRPSPVARELQRITGGLENPPMPLDSTSKTYVSLLTEALTHGLVGQEYVDSCSDFASTLMPNPEIEIENARKIAQWNHMRAQALKIPRKPRRIEMDLDPLYFSGILSGKKIVEGRAFDPTSDKNYPDIRDGDRVSFTISTRDEERFKEECQRMGLVYPISIMSGPIGQVKYAPTVHALYQMNGNDGEDLQPAITDSGVIGRIKRGAVYYAFPNYRERIRQDGFLGIEVSDINVVGYNNGNDDAVLMARPARDKSRAT